MFSPQLYTVRKFKLQNLIKTNFNLTLTKDEEKEFLITQQDNLLFRQIRLITNNDGKYNPYIIFVDIHGAKNYQEELSEIITNGFIYNKRRYVVSERSASMTRNSILSFVDLSIESKLNKTVTMDLKIKKTVISKYQAYRGLMLSSCHAIENWIPKIIVVSDCMRTIENQNIKFVVDKQIEYVDKNTQEDKIWVQKDIQEGVRDIEINAFDGTGIHHPDITKFIKDYLNITEQPTSIMWRAPMIKGVSHEMNYPKFFKEHGVEKIKDIWGVEHSVDEVMIIMTESMYKGLKYFKNEGTVEDWNNYWKVFKKYNHAIGVAKWNFSLEEEPLYTRANYQILQDLDLKYDDFATLAKDSIDWVEKIVEGDMFYTYCFLGMTANKHKPLNDYTRAILKNPEMMKEKIVREYLINLLKKYIDEMKCGKLWLKATFKIVSPDLIMLMEHIGGLPQNGCLEHDQFYTKDVNGVFNGEYLIERNPHLTRSEHVMLKAVNNETIRKYCSHLTNLCMVNTKSLVPQRLNGADFDGDLVLVVDNETMKAGVHKDIPFVIDIDDKITSLEESYNSESILKLTLRNLHSLIGETSNCATCYWNKNPQTEEQRDKYYEYIDLLSVINGKAIDSAKTGVIFNIPRYIAKYAKPMPYFMKYAGEYYANMKKLSKSDSNMNRLCREIETWQKKSIRFKRTFKDFDYTIMIDDSAEYTQEQFNAIEKIYLSFCKEIAELGQDQFKLKNYDKYKNWVNDMYPSFTREDSMNFVFDWKFYYNKYKEMCYEVVENEQALANIAVRLCYENHPNKSKKFIWQIASDGILKNIKQQKVKLPQRSEDGNLEYLGRKYKIVEVDIID